MLINRLLALIVVIVSVNNVRGEEENESFDFIVVGGGVGGCAVAGRLVENGKHSVLLIEAGDKPMPEQDIPALQGRFLGDSRTTTFHQSVPQLNAALENDGILRLMVGKGLGGGSSINGMFFNRGNPHDYNQWAKIVRDDSWNYTNMLPYLKNVETYLGEFPSEDRGTKGPITVSSPHFAPGSEEWLQAGRELGFENADPNGPQQISFTKVEFAKSHGHRVSSYTGYIEPLLVKKVRNLKVLTSTEAIKIIFNGTRAIGVQYKTGKTDIETAFSRREIVISAGVMATPILLMKSGIGPRSQLDPAGIPVIRSLSVGKYLHDQVGIRFPVILGNKSAVVDFDKDLTEEAWKTFTQFGDGPYSSSFGTAGQAFLPSTAISPSERTRNWGDIHLLAFNTPKMGPVVLPVSELKEGETYARWNAIVSRPKSRGSIRLNSTNADGPPIIDFNLLDHPIDMQVAVDAVKWIVRICEETKAFKRLGCRLPAPHKNCLQFKFKSNEYYRCYVRQVGANGLHPGGGCLMGRDWDNLSATVDSRLRVIGTAGLRIADASIIPAIVNSNPMVAVYAIAEKAADMILGDLRAAVQLGVEWDFSKVNLSKRRPRKKTRYLVRAKV